MRAVSDPDKKPRVCCLVCVLMLMLAVGTFVFRTIQYGKKLKFYDEIQIGADLRDVIPVIGPPSQYLTREEFLGRKCDMFIYHSPLPIQDDFSLLFDLVTHKLVDKHRGVIISSLEH